MEKKIIKIVYHADIEKIKKISIGDWIDLRCAEDIKIKEGEFKWIPLGISMQLPKGYEAHVVPRSSTFKNFGIIQVNHQAVFDESYCGTNDFWYFPAYCLKGNNDGVTYGKDGKTPLYGVPPYTIIKKNDRICQFRIIKKMEEIEFEEVEFLDNLNRGGVGSTGIS